VAGTSEEGVPGVFGRASETEMGFLVGVAGALARDDLDFDFTRLKGRVLDSEDIAALNFLWVDARRFGVVERGKRSVDEFRSEERGLFGVNGVGLVCLSAPDVVDDDDDDETVIFSECNRGNMQVTRLVS